MTAEKKPSRIVSSLKALTSYDQVKDLGLMIWNMAGALDPRKIKPGRVETFDQARTRLQVNNEELEAARLNHGRIFWGAFGFIFVAWGVQAWQGLTLGGVCTAIGFTSICCALMFRHSFRASQIKARKLHGVREWLENRSYWLPDVF